MQELVDFLYFHKFESIIIFCCAPKSNKRKEIVEFKVGCTKKFAVIRLIVATAFIAYFGACIWYFMSDN